MKFAYCAVFTLMTMVPLWGQQTRQVTVDSLIYDLKNPDPARRKEAARAIASNKLRSAVPALIDASKDQDDGVRLEIYRALIALNDPRAVNTYIEGSRDRRVEVREKSIAGMVNLYVAEEGGLITQTRKIIDALNPFDVDYDTLVVEPYVIVNPDVVKALAALLTDQDPGIRKKSAQALGVLRGREATAAVAESLKKESDSGARRQMIRALYKIGDREYGAVVIPFIQDENKGVHDEAIRTAGFLKVKEAREPLTKLYETEPEERRRVLKIIPASGKDDLQFKLLDALAYIGAPESVPIFVKNLQNRDQSFRRAGAEGLARAGVKDAVTALLEQKKEEKTSEALLAINFALYRLGNDLLLAELINGLDGARYDQALSYLLEFSPEETRKLYPFLRLDRKKVQMGLLEVLGRSGGADALPQLQELSQARDSAVASSANQAIRRLQARVK
ncbi:MAG TPA: HEAT repeat domain-containing protein [Acidobacteriota bacterium]